MEDPTLSCPDIAMMDNIRNRYDPFSGIVSILTSKWIGLTGELADITSAVEVLKLVGVRVLGTAVYGEAGWVRDVVEEPGVDTGPVHLRVGGGGLDDDILFLLSHSSPQSPEFIRNNFGCLFSSSPSSPSL